MILKDEEARDKWCPFVRRIIGDYGMNNVMRSNRADNGDPEDDNDDGDAVNYNCLGAGCMAWKDAGGFKGKCGLIYREI